jgi:nitrogen regulatory protein PII
MKFKLIMAMVQDERTDDVVNAARTNGATGCTVITSARGEGLKPAKTFLGLTLEGQMDVVIMLVEEHMSRHILEAVGEAGRLDREPGAGVAFQVDIEDAIGLHSQIAKIEEEIGDEL